MMRKIGTLIGFSSLLMFGLVSCMGGGDRLTEVAATKEGNQSSGRKKAAPVKPIGSAGLMSFRAISTTFSLVTGVPETNTNVASYYERSEDGGEGALLRLTEDNKSDGMSSSIQNTIFGLASTYCDETLNQNEATARARFYDGVSLTTYPVSTADQDRIIGRWINSFWQEEAKDQDVSIIKDGMNQVDIEETNNNINRNQRIRNFLMAGCTIALSNSLKVLSK